MAKETLIEKKFPADYRWDILASKSVIELKSYYKELLNCLGEKGKGRIREIFQGGCYKY